ncbi:hypothetical protein DPEC_G00308330 [Dallia pectoralis]|uniref:Uncharacterized protein n=1 Tax=Dallia pectoralis TaxID=75939 RepID=A0ACC2FET4_DALPE|nr:hypothetical protein DPEC_G00308330 [Dallia pectoralis]
MHALTSLADVLQFVRVGRLELVTQHPGGFSKQATEGGHALCEADVQPRQTDIHNSPLPLRIFLYSPAGGAT